MVSISVAKGIYNVGCCLCFQTLDDAPNQNAGSGTAADQAARQIINWVDTVLLSRFQNSFTHSLLMDKNNYYPQLTVTVLRSWETEVGPWSSQVQRLAPRTLGVSTIPKENKLSNRQEIHVG